jgi:hypothetical protein
MALSELFFLIIVFYLLYQFVFNFLVPVLRTTRHVRQQFRNMRDGMGEQAPPNQTSAHPHERHSSTRGPAEDYIDFEEIKK